MSDSYKSRSSLKVGGQVYEYWNLGALPQAKVARLPYSLKILLENLLRFEDGVNVTREDIEALLKAGLPGAEVEITDLAGDGDHYAATVIAPSFKGKSRVQQHQLVYEALKGQMGGVLHALALQTGTP